jgi:hypothetical protein
VTVHTEMASYKLQEQKPTRFFPQRTRSGRVYFFFLAAVGAVIESNPMHDETLKRYPEISCQAAESRLFTIAHFALWLPV